MDLQKDNLTISSAIENLTLAENLVDTIFEKFKIHEDYYGNILVAVTEAVTNAIEHGNAGDPSKSVNISCDAQEKKVSFHISDQGEGFDFDNLPDPTDPENIEKPNGRGIYLMKNLADDVEFSENGRIVELIFNV